MKKHDLPWELCLGGSFNPPHVGHLITARAAAEAGEFDRVRLIVAGQNPHKVNDPEVAPAALRLELTRAAVADDDFFTVDDREVRRDGMSFTADTAEQIRTEQGGGIIHWLIGVDLLPGLPTWHRAEELTAKPATLVQFTVMARGGHRLDIDSLPPTVRHLSESVVAVPRIEISSTDVRRRLREGRSVRYLVPPAVEALLHERRPYVASGM